jgi:hypothetical protein
MSRVVKYEVAVILTKDHGTIGLPGAVRADIEEILQQATLVPEATIARAIVTGVTLLDPQPGDVVEAYKA